MKENEKNLNVRKEIKEEIQKKWIYSSLLTGLSATISFIVSIISSDSFINTKIVSNIYLYIIISFLGLILITNFTFRRFYLSPSKQTKIKNDIAECYIKAINESKFNPSQR